MIVLTSNVGSRVIEEGQGGIGFKLGQTGQVSSSKRNKSLVDEELKKYFRPEFLNRLDDIIVFRPLKETEVKQIADIMLKDVINRALDKEIKLEVTERVKDRLVDEGFNPAYGARPLRRAIIRLIEDTMAERILSGDVKEGDSAIIDVDPEGLITVLVGEKCFTSQTSTTTAGIS